MSYLDFIRIHLKAPRFNGLTHRQRRQIHGLCFHMTEDERAAFLALPYDQIMRAVYLGRGHREYSESYLGRHEGPSIHLEPGEGSSPHTNTQGPGGTLEGKISAFLETLSPDQLALFNQARERVESLLSRVDQVIDHAAP